MHLDPKSTLARRAALLRATVAKGLHSIPSGCEYETENKPRVRVDNGNATIGSSPLSCFRFVAKKIGYGRSLTSEKP